MTTLMKSIREQKIRTPNLHERVTIVPIGFSRKRPYGMAKEMGSVYTAHVMANESEYPTPANLLKVGKFNGNVNSRIRLYKNSLKRGQYGMDTNLGCLTQYLNDNPDVHVTLALVNQGDFHKDELHSREFALQSKFDFTKRK